MIYGLKLKSHKKQYYGLEYFAVNQIKTGNNCPKCKNRVKSNKNKKVNVKYSDAQNFNFNKFF